MSVRDREWLPHRSTFPRTVRSNGSVMISARTMTSGWTFSRGFEAGPSEIADVERRLSGLPMV
jgi:hypothetical protein